MSIVNTDPDGVGVDTHAWRLLAKASEAAGVPINDFMIAHATRAATNVLADRRVFRFSGDEEARLEAFLAGPARLPPGLSNLLAVADPVGEAGYSGVETLAPHHIGGTFDCGSWTTTNWLREQALHAAQTGRNRVRVIRRAPGDEIAGYYALSSGTLVRGGVHTPILILARVGVDLADRNRGIGRALIRDALRQVAYTAGPVRAPVLLVNAEDSVARDWYRRLAVFSDWPPDPYHLLLRVCDLRLGLPRIAPSAPGGDPGQPDGGPDHSG